MWTSYIHAVEFSNESSYAYNLPISSNQMEIHKIQTKEIENGRLCLCAIPVVDHGQL